MYNLKKAGMRSKNSCKLLEKITSGVIAVDAICCAFTVCVSAVEYCFIQCPTGDND